MANPRINNPIKRIMAVLLSAIMLMSAIPVMAMNDPYGSGQPEMPTEPVTVDEDGVLSGTAVRWHYDNATGTLTLTLDNSLLTDSEMSYAAPDTPTPFAYSDIQHLVINPGIQGLGKYLFYCAQSLQDITFKSGNWFDIFVVGEEAFAGDGALTQIINEDDMISFDFKRESFCGTSLESFNHNYDLKLRDGAFKDCGSLKSVSAYGLQIYGNSFEGCSSLETVTANEELQFYSCSNPFAGCSSLKNLSYATQIVFSGSDIFAYCPASPTLSGPGVVAAGDGFYIGTDTELQCGTKNADLSKLPSTVTTITERAFANVDVGEVTVPEQITSVGNGAFYYSKGDAPESIDTSGLSNSIKVTFLNPETVIYDSYSTVGPDAVICGYTGSTAEQYANKYSRTFIALNSDPEGTQTDGDYEYTVTDGKATITKYNGTDTEITIPSTLGGYPVTSIGNSAFEDCSSLTSVTIPNGVTSIGEHAFESCTSLTSITIPNGVTYIGLEAFNCCESLQSIWIPDSVTWIGSLTFNNCTSLKSARLSNGLTKLTSGLFFNCEKLESISIPASITYISQAVFEGCKSLTEITIPENVETVYDRAFSDCSGLTSLYIPKKVSYVYGTAFEGCNLESITVDADNPYLDSRNNCNAIIKKENNELLCGCKNTVIPDSVEIIGPGAFKKRKELRSITIPSSVTSIKEEAFMHCEDLESITIPSSVTSFGSWTFDDTNIKDVYYLSTKSDFLSIEGYSTLLNSVIHCTDVIINEPNDDFDYTITDGKATITKYKGNDTDIVIPSVLGSYPVTTIGISALSFNYDDEINTSINSITIPDSVTSIESLFLPNCTKHIIINYSGTIEQWRGINIGEYNNFLLFYAIINCSDGVINETAKDYDYRPMSDPDDYSQYIGIYITKYIGNDADVIIPSTIAGLPVNIIGYEAFRGNSDITSVTVPDGVTSIEDYTFSECSSLISITIPATVTWLGDCLCRDSDSFTTVNYLGTQEQWESMAIGDGNSIVKEAVIKCTDAVINGEENGFGYTMTDGKATIIYYSGNETELVIPSTIGGYPVVKLDEAAIEYRSTITSVIISSGVTSIGSWVLSNCNNLTSVTIPSSVTEIGSYVLSNCKKLKEVNYNGTKEQWDAINFGKESITSAYIRCADGTVIEPVAPQPQANTVVVDGVTYSKDMKTLISYPEDKIDETFTVPSSVVTISHKAFANNTYLKAVNIPETTTTIADDAFDGTLNVKIGCVLGSSAYKYAKKKNMSVTTIQIASAPARYYTGKGVTTALVVKINGKVVKAGTHYKVAYRNNVNPGIANVYVSGLGAYSGLAASGKFRINVKGTSLKKLTKGKKQIKAKWAKGSAITGYQIQLATNKKFTKNKKLVKVGKAKTTSKTVKKLKAKKKYYVRVRTYKKVGNKTYYSTWSKAKTVKTK